MGVALGGGSGTALDGTVAGTSRGVLISPSWRTDDTTLFITAKQQTGKITCRPRITERRKKQTQKNNNSKKSCRRVTLTRKKMREKKRCYSRVFEGRNLVFCQSSIPFPFRRSLQFLGIDVAGKFSLLFFPVIRLFFFSFFFSFH